MYTCAICHSNEVAVKGLINPNTEEILEMDTDDERGYCLVCQTKVDLENSIIKDVVEEEEDDFFDD